ncbi:hypothetical protein [Halovulum sp. GXIMD14793]
MIIAYVFTLPLMFLSPFLAFIFIGIACTGCGLLLLLCALRAAIGAVGVRPDTGVKSMITTSLLYGAVYFVGTAAILVAAVFLSAAFSGYGPVAIRNDIAQRGIEAVVPLLDNISTATGPAQLVWIGALLLSGLVYVVLLVPMTAASAYGQLYDPIRGLGKGALVLTLVAVMAIPAYIATALGFQLLAENGIISLDLEDMRRRIDGGGILGGISGSEILVILGFIAVHVWLVSWQAAAAALVFRKDSSGGNTVAPPANQRAAQPQSFAAPAPNTDIRILRKSRIN